MATKTAKTTKVNITPMGDNVLVQRLEAESVTAGGIVLPESAKEKPREGTVIAVGDGRVLDDGTRRKMQVKAGDRIIFSSYAGTEIEVGGNEYLIVREDEILAVVG
ncbi:MAG: co-chaperone GroES [Myxococcales bacterium]|nr:co-chaperone GroES [Myxococcales bacterium]MCB9896833.1 co-chaperone GroES [Planctomycetota bacterium]